MNRSRASVLSRSAQLIAAVALAAAVVLVAPPPARAVASTVTAERLGGADRYDVAVNISRRLFPTGGASIVYLATGQNYPDALAAGPVAAASRGVVLLTPSATLPPAVQTELVRLHPAQIVIVGGTTSVSPDVEASVRSAVPSAAVARVSGADRYETAAALSARTFAAGATPTVFVATGASFPDALSAGAAASGQRAPVLLAAPTALPPSTKAEIERLKPSRVVIVGGPASVGQSVADAIHALGPAVDRISGSDRYETAANVATRFFAGASSIVAATGLAYPDAAASVPLAAALGAPILLDTTDAMPVATRDAVRSLHPSHIVIAGGPASISELQRGELIGWADGRLTLPPPHVGYPAYDSGYHDYYEMLTMIRSAEIAFPDLVRVFSIGKSYEGRDIWAAKISDNVGVDEDEPEVYVDTLNHAREHIGVEQALYLLRTLVGDYGTDATVHRLVDSREIWIVFAVNPDGWQYDLTGTGYRGWRKNRQPTPGTTSIGTDLNRNYGYKWGCCGGSSGTPSSYIYRGPAPFSAPETQAVRNFVLSRVVGGHQQIRAAVSLHAPGENVMWPYGYTNLALPPDMTADDHATFVAMGKKMASLNGYRPMQSGTWYVNDGDEHDWLYGVQHIFAFTFELYPLPQSTMTANFYPPDEVLARETARNRSALLYLIDAAACPYAAIGKAATYCGG